MESIKVVLSTTYSPFSYGVRVVTWSKFSHCGIITDEGTVVEAHAMHGVREVSFNEYLKHSTKHIIVELPCTSRKAAIEAARSQVGKKYDWAALFSLFLGRNKSENKRWFCSELVAWAVKQSGFGWFRDDYSSRITPEHIYMLQPV